jgi:hypothetical protein
VLYLNALNRNKSVHFEAELNRLAVAVPNRSLLYDLIHDQSEVQIAEITLANEPDVITQAVTDENRSMSIKRFSLSKKLCQSMRFR